MVVACGGKPLCCSASPNSKLAEIFFEGWREGLPLEVGRLIPRADRIRDRVGRMTRCDAMVPTLMPFGDCQQGQSVPCVTCASSRQSIEVSSKQCTTPFTPFEGA